MEQDDLHAPTRPPRRSSLPPSQLVPSLPPFDPPRLPPSLRRSVRRRGTHCKVSDERLPPIRRTESMVESGTQVRTSDGTTDLFLPLETPSYLPSPSTTRSSLPSLKTNATPESTPTTVRAPVPSSLAPLADLPPL